ncbi:hypothetical protein [Streptomyces sp. NPDC056361]|uniref:hypothetical protein n=1 Tax=Streptomyces sp. NPDC056361 TaxID=3345795 RepID=UPI0035E3B91A
MEWVVGAGTLLGLLAIVLGALTLRTRRMGWVPPWTRRNVTRPRLLGVGAVLLGSSPFLQGLEYFGVLPGLSWDVRFFGGTALLLTGIALLGASQLLAPPPGPAPHGQAPTA